MLLWKTEHSKVYKYSTIITKCIHIEIIIENGKVLQVINTCIQKVLHRVKEMY